MIRKLFWTMGSITAALMVIAFLAPYFIPAALLKQPLIRQIEQATGHSVAINGDMSLRFFPTVRIYAEDVIIGGFRLEHSTPLIKLKQVSVEAKLLPLLKKEVKIVSLALEQPKIYLEVDTHGNNNWAIMNISAILFSPAIGYLDAVANPAILETLTLKNVKISSGEVAYANAASKSSWSVNNLNLELSLNDMHSPLLAKGYFQWKGKDIAIDTTVFDVQTMLDSQPSKIKSSISSVDMSVELDGDIHAASYKGAMRAKSPSLKKLAQWLNGSKIETPTDLAFSATGQALCSATACALENSAIDLDNIHAKGKLSVSWAERLPFLTIDLETGWFGADIFLPPQEMRTTSISPIATAWAAKKTSEWSNDPIDFSSLRAVNADIRLKSKETQIRTLTIGQATYTAKLQNGRLYASVNDAEFYDGTASISLDLDATQVGLALNESWILHNVQVQPLLKDAFDSERVSGTINAKMDAASNGKSQMDLVSNLIGNGTIAINDGAIEGFNLADMARNIQSAFKEVDTAAQKTDFSELTGTFSIRNGIVINNDLAMKAPLLRVSGNGQIHLPLSTISYRLLPSIVETAQGQGGKNKEAMLQVPIIVDGPLEKPRFRPDVANIVKQAIQNPDQLKQQLKDARGALKGLLKGN